MMELGTMAPEARVIFNSIMKLQKKVSNNHYYSLSLGSRYGGSISNAQAAGEKGFSKKLWMPIGPKLHLQMEIIKETDRNTTPILIISPKLR